MEKSYFRCIGERGGSGRLLEEHDDDDDDEESRSLLPPLLSNISACSFDEGIVLLLSTDRSGGRENAADHMQFMESEDRRRRKTRRRNYASAVTAGATCTILLLAFAASSSVRIRQSYHTAPTQPTEDPCATGTWSLNPIIGSNSNNHGDLGVLYSVAGSSAYAENEFIPLMHHLRHGLRIPDAKVRAEKRKLRKIHETNITQVKQTQVETRYALVTQPHLCRSVLQPVLSFFDVITVVDLDNITSAISNVAGKDTIKAENKRRTNQEVERRAETRRTFDTTEQRRRIDLHRAKAVKVLALSRYAPFKQTLFLDLDMVPCQKNFARALLRSVIKGSFETGTFDIALPFASHPNVNLPMPAVDKRRHYYRRNEVNDEGILDKEEEELGGRGMNQHNSAAVMLNMTSTSTRELLRRFEDDFFSPPSSDLSGKLPTLDQPSLGRAMFSMFSEEDASLHHVDLDAELVCRKGSRFERTMDNGLADISCGQSNNCIVIHKPVHV